MRQALENAWLIVPIDSPRFLEFVFSGALRAVLGTLRLIAFGQPLLFLLPSCPIGTWRTTQLSICTWRNGSRSSSFASDPGAGARPFFVCNEIYHMPHRTSIHTQRSS